MSEFMMVHIYKGEGRYAVEPMIENIWGMRIYCEEYRILDENADALTIASAVDEMKRYIEVTPSPDIMVREAPQPERISKYHDKWIKFLHNNLLASVDYDEDKILVSSMERRTRRGGGSGYCGCIDQVQLPVTASMEELGQAILQVFDAAEQFYSVGKYKPKRQKKTKTTEE